MSIDVSLASYHTSLENTHQPMLPLKYQLLAAVLLWTSVACLGQSKRIADLERKAESLTGTELIQTKMTLANLYLDKDSFDKALENAQQAQSLAEEGNHRDWVRRSLAIQGKILQKKAAAGLKTPTSGISEPVAATPDPAAAITSSVPPKSSPGPASAESARRQADMEKILREKEKEIAAMSDEQARLELLYSRQRNVLDSLSMRGLRDSMALALSRAQTQEQAAQLATERNRRNLLLALALLVIIVAGGLYARYKGVSRYNTLLTVKNEQITVAQKRSEELLLNILPAAIASELKQSGAAQARQYEHATVLFTDFVGFSRIANAVSAEQLVADLDYCYGQFDKITETHGLEKIKTIGDSYMCAGGLPESDTDHALRMVAAALEMQSFLKEWNLQRTQRGEAPLEARIGIHTGPLVAGVVGYRKFAYDIWGDTVNIASRVESAGEGGRVNISESTFQLVKGKFACTFRGVLPVKNLPPIAMYYVEA